MFKKGHPFSSQEQRIATLWQSCGMMSAQK